MRACEVGCSEPSSLQGGGVRNLLTWTVDYNLQADQEGIRALSTRGRRNIDIFDDPCMFSLSLATRRGPGAVRCRRGRGVRRAAADHTEGRPYEKPL